MIYRLKKLIKSNEKLFKIFNFILEIFLKVRFLLRFFEIFFNKILIFLNKKVTLRSVYLYRSTNQKDDIKKILQTQIYKFKKNNNRQIFTALEIGSLVGDNLEHTGKILSKNFENFLLVSIDPFTDYVNKKDKKNIKSLNIRSKSVNLLYKYFVHNISLLKFRNKILHFRDYSVNILKLLKQLNLKFDFIYIDGAHYYKNIKEDFTESLKIVKKKKNYNGIICGDDYTIDINDHSKFQLTKKQFKLILKENINREQIYLKSKNNNVYKKIGFHNGITLFFSDKIDKIHKLNSGIWYLK